MILLLSNKKIETFINSNYFNQFMALKISPYSNSLYPAANCKTTGYHRVWIRDNIYTNLGIEAAGDIKTAVKNIHALLDILLKHEYKIDWMIKQPYPKLRWRYIHPRYDEQGNEILEEWGNKQNDAVGALLWRIGELNKKTKILRDENDKRIVQKLVYYLEAIEFWHDKDNGMWEENEEVHASSVGACLAGLLNIQNIVHVPLHLIAHAEETLKQLLPRESKTKDVDLALLSLIYPYNIVTKEQAKAIIKNVENKLLREKGVIRYVGDKYYYKNGEAQWTMGLPWLAICHKILGNNAKYIYFVEKTRNALTDKGELPELYFADSDEHNENSPLFWSMSLKAVAENFKV
ncbi:glycoside hydrolase family 15 [Candidatus Woesearchaeota archaeon]|nr:MAG: glycoside hydrolase family 15 [Candidatus Woesearchaeota archaeon ex4484_78]RLE45784.1 MAG: glycoside hydrolase family 15 [Candidatus Woesearchaeota archaeon]